MRVIKPYRRERAREYAERWALSRNPLFYDYTGIGGNCTNFVSQSLYAGSCEMNFTPVYGWYYLSSTDRTASWTGVDYLYQFLVGNTGVGPFAREVSEDELTVGDVIQLQNAEGRYYHTLLVTGFGENTYLVAAQSNDAYNRPLDSYEYSGARFLHIEGVGVEADITENCFDALIEGRGIAARRESGEG